LTTDAGNALFKSAIGGYVPRYRLVGIAAIVSLAPIALVAPLLVLLVLVTAVLVAVAAWDTPVVGAR